MSAEIAKVGIISCSGEALPGGTISRLAARRVLELLRPDRTVTLCLPLFLAGNEGERNFARTHPTITIDGCEKQCAKWGTEKHSGPVSVSLVVPEILQSGIDGCHCSSGALTQEDTEAVWAVAERTAIEVDSLVAASDFGGAEGAESGARQAQCACSSPLPGGKITVGDKVIAIAGLPLIFEQCVARGVSADSEDGAELLKAVKIYHPVAADEEAEYRDALLQAYREFRSGRTPAK
ncbi:MAG: putative zinc-binding protein [Terracidiphilus sp.]